MGSLLGDLRYACRMLVKSKALTLVAVLSLALGIGANLTIFGLINAVLLRPPRGVTASEQLALMLRVDESGWSLWSYPEYVDFRDRSQAFSGLLAYRALEVNLSAGGVSERLQGAIVSGNYFHVLGVRAALGRTLTADDDRNPGAHPVAVISRGLFERRFGRDANVIGRTMIVNAHEFVIIGVAAEGFHGTETGEVFDLWVPLAMQAQVMPQPADLLRSREESWLAAIGRLKAGRSLEQAQAELDLIAARIRESHPRMEGRMRGVKLSREVGLGPVDHQIVARFLGLLLGAVALVLLIACANVAGLLLVRATSRRQEIAIRLALGASRWRIVRLLLAESLLLALLATAAGLLIPAFTTKHLLALFNPLTPEALDFSLDPRLAGFTLLVAVATVLLCGLAPALRSSRPDLIPELKESVLSGRRWQSGGIFASAQIALSLVLLAGAGLMVRTLGKLSAVDPGFETRRVLALSLDLQRQGYDEERGREFYTRLLERASTIAGVEKASLAAMMPLGWGSKQLQVFIDGQPAADGRARAIDCNIIAPGYWETLGIALIEGRDFSAHDSARAPRVAIINETMARRYWPGESPLGKRFRTAREGPAVEIVGLVRTIKHRQLEEEPQPVLYLPHAQSYEGRMVLHLRTLDDPLGIAAAVREEVKRMDPHLALFEVMTLAQRLAESIWWRRTMATLIVLFAAAAVVLASIGLYGAISYMVARRRREIGIRLALGATRRDVFALVIREGMKIFAVGAAVGLVAALALTRLLASFLYSVSASDGVSFAAVSSLLLIVAFAACCLPARRAARVDPMMALRDE